jgi:hypothetical protein
MDGTTAHKTITPSNNGIKPTMPARSRSSASNLLALTLAVTSLIFLSIHFRMGSLIQEARRLYEESDCGHDDAAAPPARRPKLADGCHHVFLDVGANIGIHARFLFEPELYPDAKARKWFDDAYGADRDPRDICVFAFEPNPKHTQRLQDLSQAYAALGYRYYPIMAGVSDNEGTLEFVPSRDDLGRGFTARGSGQGNDQNKHMVSVPVHRLASWLLDEIDGRLPPAQVFGSYDATEQPKVVMKLDIETLEYIVLPDLLLSGALCQVLDAVYGEVHYQFFPLDFPDNGLHLEKALDAKQYFNDQLQMIQMNRNCHTTWSIEDDESYSYDGQPLPTKPTEPVATVAAVVPTGKKSSQTRGGGHQKKAVAATPAGKKHAPSAEKKKNIKPQRTVKK